MDPMIGVWMLQTLLSDAKFASATGFDFAHDESAEAFAAPAKIIINARRRWLVFKTLNSTIWMHSQALVAFLMPSPGGLYHTSRVYSVEKIYMGGLF